MSKISEAAFSLPAKYLPEYPRPWRIDISEAGGRALDRDGHCISMFDADDDVEFWQGIVDIVNFHDDLFDIAREMSGTDQRYMVPYSVVLGQAARGWVERARALMDRAKREQFDREFSAAVKAEGGAS